MQRLLHLILGLLTVVMVNARPCGYGNDAILPWKAGAVVSEKTIGRYGLDKWFVAMPLPDSVFVRMQGKSYPKGCLVSRGDLRYVRLLYVGFDGKRHMGELVCNKAIAADVVCIFKTLYENRYPVESVRLIDDFDASDERSMRANNTSCFCYRVVKGSRKLSAHARGMALDINPLYNPCVRRVASGQTLVQPHTASRYANRQTDFPYKINLQDLAYRTFVKHGFRWGGAWRSVKDYQHFEK